MARYPYQSFIQDGNGRAVESVTVTVYEADTTTLATIYAAKSGGSAITGSYVTTEESGYFIFYVDSSDYAATQMYDITPSKSGYEFDTIEDISLVITNSFDDIYTDTIYEKTVATGVTIDGVLLKDSEVTTDVIKEKTEAAGVTIDGVLLKDSEVTTDVIKEKTEAAGVTIDSLKIKDAGFAIGSDADGDDYQRIAGVLARRAIGAANLKSFVNAAGTAKEWAAGMVSVAYTYDLATASGTQALAGSGFTPNHAIVLYGLDTQSAGIGIKGTVEKVLVTMYEGTASAYLQTRFMTVNILGGNQLATLAFGSDGGTLTWTKNGTISGTLNFVVLWLR